MADAPDAVTVALTETLEAAAMVTAPSSRSAVE
jgi:hypothetical protein